MAEKKTTLVQMGAVCVLVGIAVAATGGSWAGTAGCIIAGIFMFAKARTM